MRHEEIPGTADPTVAQAHQSHGAASPTLPPSISGAADQTPALAPINPVPPAPAAIVATPPPPAGPAKPDERVSSFVESIKVAGIRSFGADSRVLMNDRVVRVNDIVDRTLGVTLIVVASETLTFSDANGATYRKKF